MEEPDTTVADLIETMRRNPLDAHAQEIGRMCMMWSHMEFEIALLLSSLIDVKDPVVNNTLLGALDLRAKINAILPIAFSKKPDDAWFDDVQTELNEINGDLRPERNRMTHDYWIHLPDEVIRMQHTAKVVKDQKTKRLTLSTNKPTAVGDIIALTIRIAKCSGKISDLRRRYQGQPTFPRIPSGPTPRGNQGPG